MTPAASVVITTKNRKEDLRRALISTYAQNVPIEVLVTDDASDDGTAEMVSREFPAARLLRSEKCMGLIVQRNRAARAATTKFIFSLDDDAEFGSPETVKHTLTEFTHPRIGAVAIPHVDTQSGTVVNRAAPDDGHVWCVASFSGGACVVRRDLFLELGGFREELVHQGEESDYCIRMLAAGYVVRLGGADMILHHESPRRSFERMDFYGSRNDVGFAWRYAPVLWLGPHLFGTSINMLRTSLASGRFMAHLRGANRGWIELLSGVTKRAPIRTQLYRLFRILKKSGPLPLAEFEHQLADLDRELQSKEDSVAVAGGS